MKKALITFLKIVVFFIGWAVLSGLVIISIEDPAVWRFFAELIPFGVIAVFTLVFFFIEKRDVRIPILNNGLKGSIVGLGVGIVWIVISAVILLAIGVLKFDGKNEVSNLWLWVISAFINVIMQELLVRGYIYQLLKTKYNLVVAVIFTTALFTLMHGGAFEVGIIPVINVVTMCLFTTALYEAEGTILAPIMAHAVWNILGALVFGGVSLADDYPSLYSMKSVGSEILSGGDYKIEASIVVTVINVLLMILFFVIYLKKSRQR